MISSEWNLQQQQRKETTRKTFLWLTVRYSFLDLTPEQQKMVIELRRRKQELLLEIQVSLENFGREKNVALTKANEEEPRWCIRTSWTAVL